MNKVPPDDILKAAHAVVMDGHGNPMVIDIADAIYAERLRCAEIAEQHAEPLDKYFVASRRQEANELQIGISVAAAIRDAILASPIEPVKEM